MAVDEFGREVPTALQKPLSAPRSGGSHYHTSSSHHHQTSSRYHDSQSLASASYHYKQQQQQQQQSLHSSPSHPHYGSGVTTKSPLTHVSQTYVEQPLLCQVLWKEEEEAATTKEDFTTTTTAAAAVNEAATNEAAEHETSKSNDDDANMQQDSSTAMTTRYDNYKQQYCLRYVRSILNHHLDDSWLRDLMSPRQRYLRAQLHQQRASLEAQLMHEQLQQIMQQSATGGREDTMQVLDQAVSLSHGLKTTNAHGSISNAAPSLHVSSTFDRCFVVHALPHYVTDEQVQAAIMSALVNDNSKEASSGEAMAVPVIYSSTPTPEHLYTRSVLAVYQTPDELQAAWKKLVSRATPQSTVYLAAATAAPTVPRRFNNNNNSSSNQQHYSHEQSAGMTIQLNIDATDQYGRREIDANGRGGPPTETHVATTPPSTLLPLRLVQCQVSLPHQVQRVTVLSASLSTTARVFSDYDSVRTIAKSLDARHQVPHQQRLEAILQSVEKQLINGNVKEHVDVKEKVTETALLLDICIAYLRRVHLVSFYHGLAQENIVTNIYNLADVVIGGGSAPLLQGGSTHAHLHKHFAACAPASTVYLRLENADTLLSTDDVKIDSARENDANTVETTADRGDEDARDNERHDHEQMEVTSSDNDRQHAKPAVVRDLLVERLDIGIAQALRDCQEWMEAYSAAGMAIVVSEQVDRDAKAIEQTEAAAVDQWIQDHSILDGDGRARCSFHFCHKLFKNSSFLNKHLLKKHGEFLKAEQAKSHDEFMMAAWDACENRPVPDVLVDCGKQFGLVSAKVFGRQPDCVDPEPALWQREEDKRQRDEQQRQRRDQERHQRKQMQLQQAPPMGGPRTIGYVDVDEMKEEKIDVSFDDIEVPDLNLKRKKKKRKLL
ncbi:hypothetical protein MPSEU_000343400 [Mayamaea pseudoterrestris]|nr:hypothetical protein MPSEU_000343400 [Mayamaea pseudoterrestris]